MSQPSPEFTTLKEGDGENFPGRGSRVKIEYQGILANGKQFDSSHHLRNNHLAFVLGDGKVIKCWERAIKEISIGQMIKLKCPPELAYGEQGSPPKVPKNATLTFYIKLLGYKAPKS